MQYLTASLLASKTKHTLVNKVTVTVLLLNGCCPLLKQLEWANVDLSAAFYAVGAGTYLLMLLLEEAFEHGCCSGNASIAAAVFMS